ncbi:hypothetical protein HPO96_37125 [Kribbella sandramycini]|uniref:Uncharacterized protein n=1 Tax=Kribbella sandramycini TaxID=60450 RepID=A0A7Y4L7R7_9ACTN|nr:hypothetical protein [Kribbella sandramycini]MBB6564423.1 hypothetical protein [Kribbella sandramycini]NOL45883.1 hypothetical protein [Kribbella sandramycini]
MTTIHEAYAELIQTLKDLEGVLRPAVAAQYDAPPGGTSDAAPNGIPNPTLDTVIDARRSDLSDEIRRTAAALLTATRAIRPQVPALGAALARWEGETP